ncbi:TspO/MBR family protein [Sphingomonas sp. TZW2008]|uniref:TspO/MBR family protein n=1 Tax=Sphingomonas sp. TZW2008 TaxID=1917973 RepID=UPI000A26C1CC|nr:TspO/MBR family protein [Sphingomonas sp. TZW2008]
MATLTIPRSSPLVAGTIVAGVLGASALLGRRNAPDASHPGVARWYRRLSKPPFTPPKPVFGAVWPVLESAMAVGGYRVLRAPPSPQRTAALGLWLGTSAMIGGWTELFFRRHALSASTAASAATTVASAGYVAAAARVDRPAALAGAPLTGWLVFATVLANSVRRRNA